jgi:hypothetical protein
MLYKYALKTTKIEKNKKINKNKNLNQNFIKCITLFYEVIH